MSLFTKAVVFGAGYVLGTKAGRERYDQIANLARRASERLEEFGALDRARPAQRAPLELEDPRATAPDRPDRAFSEG